jgi:ABC-type spermidine/putrescine transport system permease subunit II
MVRMRLVSRHVWTANRADRLSLARTFLWLPIALCKIYSSATKEICDWTRSGWTIHEAESSVALRRAFLSDS